MSKSGKKNLIDKETAIQEFVEGITPILWASAFVSDDWLNQIKVYRGVDLKDKASYIRMLNMGLLLNLLIQRVSDILDAREIAFLEYKVQDKLISTMRLIELQEKDKESGTRELYKIIKQITNRFKESAESNKITITEVYTNSLAHTLGGKEYIEDAAQYASYLVNGFEEHNFRQNLLSRLKYLDND